MQLLMTLAPYVLLALNVIVFLGLLYGISKRVQKLRQRMDKCEARLETESTQLATGVAALKTRVDDLEEGRPPADTTASMAAGGNFNSTVRSKVLKMHRLGQSTERIAETLRVPQGEVDLLVKVHRIVMRPYQQAVVRAAEEQTV